jgi:hypothetical protein
MGRTAFQDYTNRYLQSSTSLKTPVKTFADKGYNDCVQWCHKNDASSQSWGDQGLYGFCEQMQWFRLLAKVSGWSFEEVNALK